MPFAELKWGETWQAFRNQRLLQPDSNTSLLFSPPLLDQQGVHVLMGRTYAKQLINDGQLDVPLTWLDNEFAINAKEKLIVCPYFDYRQLSNMKIVRLTELLANLKQTS